MLEAPGEKVKMHRKGSRGAMLGGSLAKRGVRSGRRERGPVVEVISGPLPIAPMEKPKTELERAAD